MRFEGSWVLKEIDLGSGLVGHAVLGRETTIEVDGDRVAGCAGINRFMGPFGADGSLGPLATTMMAGPPELMEQERVFLGHLAKANGAETRDDRLEISVDGSVVLVFGRSGTGGAPETS